MEEGYMNPFVEMGASLAELVIKGTASAVNKKIRAAKEIKDSEKLRIMYDELINEVLQEREEAVDKYSIPVGTSITEQVQKGIEESDMVIFWVTDNFLKSNWCKMEMKVYIGRMIEENIRMFIVMDDEIEIKKLPLFLRDIKHLRREHRSVIEIAEEIAGIIKQM